MAPEEKEHCKDHGQCERNSVTALERSKVAIKQAEKIEDCLIDMKKRASDYITDTVFSASIGAVQQSIEGYREDYRQAFNEYKITQEKNYASFKTVFYWLMTGLFFIVAGGNGAFFWVQARAEDRLTKIISDHVVKGESALTQLQAIDQRYGLELQHLLDEYKHLRELCQ